MKTPSGITSLSLKYTITENMTHDRKPTRNKSRTRKRQERNTGPITFVGVDGEGVTLEDGTHKYVLLGVGDRQYENPEGITWQEAFEFLWSQFRTGPVAYTGFFLGYDFCQMLKGLREERARMLYTSQGRIKRQPRSGKRRMPFPVQCEGWEFDLLGSKRLRLRKNGSDRWMYICDAGPFFQKSFLSVIDPQKWSEPVVTREEYDKVAEGKARRGTAVLDSDMRYYNALENEILARVLSQLDRGLRTLGIHLSPGQWYGPGQAASAWLKGRAITAGRLGEVTPQAALEAARSSYFGGWFEIMAHGIVPGASWEYDVNSAYPHIISALPCLEHGEWRHNDVNHSNSNRAATLVHATVSNTSRHVGSMLHRDNSGNISRPGQTEGWYWLDELDASARALGSSWVARETWSYQPCGCPPPLGEVSDIYALRQRVGKNTPLGIACKLIPNSLYGKFAQSVGTPEYGNPLYASRITSGCRRMILNAISSHPDKERGVLMVATDGVYFRTPHPYLPIGPELGYWSVEEKRDLCLFKPGVYWDDQAREKITAGEAPVFKARGVNARDFGAAIGEVDRLFRLLADGTPSHIEWPTVEFPVSFSMVTALQALQRNNWDAAGTLVKEPMARQSSDPSLKRSRWHWEGGLLRSRPAENEPYQASKAYEKRFGMDDPFSDESMEAAGISPDGYPGDLWKEVLYEN
jgi:hypothetical protein